MPIKPENRHRYPANWTVIKAQMMARAGNRCEWPECGLGHGWIGYRDEDDRFIVLSRDGKVSDVADINGNYAGHKVIRIVLTCAHLDHTPENCDPKNLRIWCQRHHLRYDLGHHKHTAYMTRKANACTSDLFKPDEGAA